VLRPDVAWTAGMIERFQRETRGSRRLEHAQYPPYSLLAKAKARLVRDAVRRWDVAWRAAEAFGALPPDAPSDHHSDSRRARSAHKAGWSTATSAENIMLDTARGPAAARGLRDRAPLDGEAGAGLTRPAS